VTAGPNSTITLGNGNDKATAGNASIVTVGNGNDTVTVGADSVTTAFTLSDKSSAYPIPTVDTNTAVTYTNTGANGNVTVGNGNDIVIGGSGDTIKLGNGIDTIYAGANDIMTLGTGNDTVAFGVGPSPAAFGSETVNGFNAQRGQIDNVQYDQIDLSLAQFVSYAAMMSNHEITSSGGGANTIITAGSNSVTLDGVAMSSLTASNFHFS
jgi:hypothetical protein